MKLLSFIWIVDSYKTSWKILWFLKKLFILDLTKWELLFSKNQDTNRLSHHFYLFILIYFPGSNNFFFYCEVKVVQSCLTLQSNGLNNPWNSPGQNTEVDSLSFLQAIFPTQSFSPGFPYYRWILYQLNHKGVLFFPIRYMWIKVETTDNKTQNILGMKQQSKPANMAEPFVMLIPVKVLQQSFSFLHFYG